MSATTFTTCLFSTICTRLMEHLLEDLRNSSSLPPTGGLERISKVGMVRLELTTSAFRTPHSSHLSYIPSIKLGMAGRPNAPALAIPACRQAGELYSVVIISPPMCSNQFYYIVLLVVIQSNFQFIV